MIRAYIREDFPTLSLVEQHDGERPTRILRILEGGDATTIRWDNLPTSFAAPVEPTLRIGDSEARAILEALTRHYDGAEDTRALRRDYDAERKRVDDLTSTLASLAQNLAAGRTSTPATLTVPGANSNRCVRCGMARALRLEDGSIEWVTSPATPPHCNHELWEEP